MGNVQRHWVGGFRGQQAQASQPFGLRRLGAQVLAGSEAPDTHWFAGGGGELNVQGGQRRRNGRIVKNHELHGQCAGRFGLAADLEIAGAVVSLQPCDLHGQGGRGKDDTDHHPSGEGGPKAVGLDDRPQSIKDAKDLQAGPAAQASIRSREVRLVDVEAGDAVGALDG